MAVPPPLKTAGFHSQDFMNIETLYMIRADHFGNVVWAAAKMEECPASFRIPYAKNGEKDYIASCRTSYWNAETLNKKTEYNLLNSVVGLYMWGTDKDTLFRKWAEIMTPRIPSTGYDSHISLLLSQGKSKSAEVTFSVTKSRRKAPGFIHGDISRVYICPGNGSPVFCI